MVVKSKLKSKIKTTHDSKILNRVFDDYDDQTIQEMYNLLTGDSHNITYKPLVGQRLTARLVGESKTDYLFDIGYRDTVRVEKKKSEINALLKYADDSNSIVFNTEVEVLITNVSETPFMVTGSLAALHKSFVYADLVDEEGLVLSALITGVLPVGFNVEVEYQDIKISAFMPNILSGINKLSPEQSQSMLGKYYNVMVESYSVEKNAFIMSRKKYLQSLIPQEIAKLNTRTTDGGYTTYTGIITGTTKFGIFVEFSNMGDENCLTGMIHASNLNDHYKSNIENVQAGEEITFFIKEILKDKLILTQVIRETLWDTIKKDQIFENATVSDMKSFGLLVRLDSETQGLVHSSEIEKLSTTPINGSKIKVKVVAVQKDIRKIFLTLV
jgi:ribosomal protein S1